PTAQRLLKPDGTAPPVPLPRRGAGSPLSPPTQKMREALVVHCECGDPDCHAWVRLNDQDAELISCRDLSIIHPQHAHTPDRIWDIQRPYLIVQPDRAAV